MCALNDILVHGKSAAEDLEDQLSASSLPEDDLPDDPKPHGLNAASAEQQQAQVAPDAAVAAHQDAGHSHKQGDMATAGLLAADPEINAANVSNNSTQNGES